MEIGSACLRATKKYPDGRTGTRAGYLAHRAASEAACDACLAAMRDIGRATYQPKEKRPPQTPEQKREKDRLAAARWRAANPERSRELWRRYEATRDPGLRNAGQRRRWWRKRDAIDALKDKPCADCGVRYPPYVMHFDHRDPATKSFNVGHAIRCPMAQILAEIEKCDLVCANCHAERTWGPRRKARAAAA